MAKALPTVSRLSVRSLLIGICNEFQEQPFSYATGFIVDTLKGPCLATARHCATGRHHYTGYPLESTGSMPFSFTIFHRSVDEHGHLTNVVCLKRETLHNQDGTPKWFEHPNYSDLCDFVLLPLTDHVDCGLFPICTDLYATELSRPNQATDQRGFVLNPDDRMFLHVSDQVSVIGYPFGIITAHCYPLWATGHLSSEPYSTDFVAATYIDCRGRGGQSGSPVYAVRSGSYESIGGDSIVFDGYAYMFVGLYSGRISGDSDIGMVWDARMINNTTSSIRSAATAKTPTDRKIAGPIQRMPTLADSLKVMSDR